ncbi:MAG TPA: 2Fe-2S iron-sulfur cluster-binding protein [Nevskiaceae bacterium]|nr:2Fe-2S iron-sulfur cluster-binding protein [Nevskiaceae bacterium]
MAQIKVVNRAGATSTLDVSNGTSLMDALRDADYDVAGTCGGAMACGTCHVYVRAGAERLPPKSDDEQMMLEAIGELVTVKAESRLSCQLTASDEITGLEVEIGPIA